MKSRVWKYRGVLLVFLVTSSITFVVWRALVRNESNHIQQSTELELFAIRTQLVSRLEGRFNSLRRMAKRWETIGQPDRLLWQSDALNHIEDHPGYQALEWADPDFIIRWVVPKIGNEMALGLNLHFERERERTLERARDSRNIQISQPIELIEGMRGFFAAIPLYSKAKFLGFILGVFRTQELFDSILLTQLFSGWNISLMYGADVIFHRGEASSQVQASEVEFLEHGVKWRLRVWATPQLLSQMGTNLPVIVLLGGLFVSCLMSGVVLLWQITRGQRDRLKEAKGELEDRVAERTDELSRSNAELEREIGERTAAEERLMQLASDLTRSNRELEQFAYAASHDLKEPLRMVASYLQLLSKRYQGRIGEDGEDYIQYAVDGAKRMKALIDDLLAYSRVGSGKDGEALQSTDCNRVMERVVQNLSLSIEESKAQLSHDPLPTVMAYPMELVQLFQNLVGNAIKFRGELPPQVHVAARRDGRYWHFSVRDNGIGFEMQYADRIFLLFQRLHGKEEYSGTGIGLAICKKIVENHGGRIWAESKPQSGSTFSFTLPTTQP